MINIKIIGTSSNSDNKAINEFAATKIEKIERIQKIKVEDILIDVKDKKIKITTIIDKEKHFFTVDIVGNVYDSIERLFDKVNNNIKEYRCKTADVNIKNAIKELQSEKRNLNQEIYSSLLKEYEESEIYKLRDELIREEYPCQYYLFINERKQLAVYDIVNDIVMNDLKGRKPFIVKNYEDRFTIHVNGKFLTFIK